MDNATFECSAANWWLSNCPSGEFSGPLIQEKFEKEVV
jgi:hypothetical protein